jgi:RNA polymerase sigma-70 factor (ECF subfamily)
MRLRLETVPGHRAGTSLPGHGAAVSLGDGDPDPRLNKLRASETHRVVWRKGASVAELELLYRERYDHFAGVAAAVLGAGDAGRDAVQSAFATALRERHSFRGDGPLEAWVWRIVVNEAHKLARERRALPLEASQEPSTNGHPDDELGLRRWIAALPERQRAALFLRYYADLDYKLIATILEVEVGTVSATLSAAHTKLRCALREVRP